MRAPVPSGHVVAAVDAVPHEQHLTGQVRVVGARPAQASTSASPCARYGPTVVDHHPGRAG